ncbi:SCP-like protein [Cooperia oncophora]
MTMENTWTTRLATSFLQYHEGTRFTLALGESPNSEGGYHLPAKNLFKMRWNCDLEKEARTLTQGCPKNVSGAPEHGRNLYHDAVDAWLWESDRLPMGPNATFNDTRMYSFANMAYQEIYEVGCHYEQCESGSSAEASVLCIYNTDGSVTGTKQGKYNFLSDAVDEWLFLSDVLPMGPNATFNDTRMYSFANMAYQEIYEVGCHYEQCESGSSAEASVLCIYNTEVPLNVQLYEIGSWNQTIAGCAWNDTVCEFIKLQPPEKSNVKIFSANYLTRFRTDSYEFSKILSTTANKSSHAIS